MARKMKDSGIEWIGEIPEGWTKNKVIRLFDTIGSGTTPKNVTSDFPVVNWIQSGDITGSFMPACKNVISANLLSQYSALKVYPAPFIIIAMYGASVGNASISLIDGCVNQACCVLSSPSCNLHYAFYVIKSAQSYLVRKAVGGGQPNISQETIKQLWLPLPPLSTQDIIVRNLDAICSKIDDLLSSVHASIEEYKKLKQAVITQSVTKGVRGEREIKESKLPWASKIPKAWNTCAIRHIMFECKERTKDGHEEQLSVTQQFGIIKSSDASIANPSLSLDDWRIVAIGDIVFNKYKAHSGVFFVSPFSGIVTFNYSVYRCFPNCYAKYFEYQYKTHGCISEFRTRMHGVGNSISPLYTKDLMKIKVVCPPLDEQKEISNYLDAKCAEIDKLIAKKEQLVIELESYKKSLIYEVVTGKREV